MHDRKKWPGTAIPLRAWREIGAMMYVWKKVTEGATLHEGFITCISRESNPGHIDGNDVFYH